MLSFFKWIFGKSLDQHLSATRTVRVKGIRFQIRRLNALNYLDGSKALRQSYDTYKSGSSAAGAVDFGDKKITEHFSHVLVGGVVAPKLSFDSNGDGIHVEQMFTDWDLVVGLYNEIMWFTYGKKKIQSLASLEKKP